MPQQAAGMATVARPRAEMLVADIGSTITKLCAFSGLAQPDGRAARFLGQGVALTTTAEGDVGLGLEAARVDLEKRLGIDTALRALQNLVASVPPGDNQYGVAIDAIARHLEQRGDTTAAVEVLRRLDGVHRMVYPRSGVHGFSWLLARTHLLDLERQLGRTDRAAALVQELEGWVAVADPDFVVRSALR